MIASLRHRTHLHRGIGTVYQHFTLVPNLSILENVVLGAERRLRPRSGRGAKRRVASMLAEFGLDVSPRTEVRHLALGQRQRVEIIKVLFRGTRVLLLDEPTSVLTPGEVAALLDAAAPACVTRASRWSSSPTSWEKPWRSATG